MDSLSTALTTGVTISTTSGSVRGTAVDGAHAFLGIPYAAPAIGARRFAPPVPPDPWDGVRPAVEFGPTAPQAVYASPLVAQEILPGDDYLNLNVFTPDPGAASLPVLFNIHGGGFVFGSNIHPTSGNARQAARGFVVVSINYRLGFDGFLTLRDATPNRGVLDWLLALEWVQDNIAAFGGDPDQVTICGYSAGSAACCILMGLPQAAGLFQGAIAMSGTAWNQVGAGDAEEWADWVVEGLGVERTIEGLLSVPQADLMQYQEKVAPVIPMAADPLATFDGIAAERGWPGPRPGRACLGAVVDGEVVPENTHAAIAAGTGKGRSFVIGCTANEMDVLMGMHGDAVTRDGAEQALGGIGLDAATVAHWFDALSGRTPAQVLGAALTVLDFRLPAIRLAEAHARAGSPAYLYRFAWQPPTPFGAVHCLDLPFAFDACDIENFGVMCGGEPPASLAEDYAGAISRFVIDGDPGWPRYDEDTRSVMVFDVPSAVQADPDLDRAARDVFGKLR